MGKDDRARINEVLTLLAGGDRSVFDEAYNLLWPLVLKAAKRLIGSSGEAEDIAQETLIKIFEQASEFDSSKDGLAWAFTIAKFEFMTLRKTKVRRKEVNIEESGSLMASQNIAEQLEDKQIDHFLVQIIAELSGEDQEVIRLYLNDSGEAHSPKLRKRFQRAVARIRTAWKEAYG